MTEVRALEEVQEEKANAATALDQLEDELGQIAIELEKVRAEEALDLEKAVREGRDPKSSKKIASLTQRQAEIQRQIPVVQTLLLRLSVEDLRARIPALEEELHQKTEGRQELDAELAEVKERRQKAENARYVAQQALSDVRQALRGAEQRLMQIDERFAAEQATALEERRRQTERSVRGWWDQGYQSALARSGMKVRGWDNG